MEAFSELASALQGESHTSESIAWANELHDAEAHFADELHRREQDAETRRSKDQRRFERLLLSKKLQVELDIGRRDWLRDSLQMRASAIGNLLVSVSVMIGCAFMFVYQIALPAVAPDSPENFTYSLSVVNQHNDSAGAANATRLLIEPHVQRHAEEQLRRYREHLELIDSHSGGSASFALHSFFLWLSIATLGSAVLVGLLLQRRLKQFNVHGEKLYDCGHVHGHERDPFASYYTCRCRALEQWMRAMFSIGTVLLIAAGCVAAWEVSIVSFGSLAAACLFLVPVLFALLVIAVGHFLVPEDTVHPAVREARRLERIAMRRKHQHGRHRHHDRQQQRDEEGEEEEEDGDDEARRVPASAAARGDAKNDHEDEEDDDEVSGRGNQHQSRQRRHQQQQQAQNLQAWQAIDGATATAHSPDASPRDASLNFSGGGSASGGGGDHHAVSSSLSSPNSRSRRRQQQQNRSTTITRRAAVASVAATRGEGEAGSSNAGGADRHHEEDDFHFLDEQYQRQTAASSLTLTALNVHELILERSHSDGGFQQHAAPVPSLIRLASPPMRPASSPPRQRATTVEPPAHLDDDGVMSEISD